MSTEQLSVLLLGDNGPRRRTLRTCLSNDGFAVKEVCTDEDAHQAFENRIFNLALLDIDSIPDVRSIDLCREIRALGD